MENVQGVHGVEGGSDPEFHPLNATNFFELPNNIRPELPLLLRVLQEDGRPLPIGSYTKRRIARKVHYLIGVKLEIVTE